MSWKSGEFSTAEEELKDGLATAEQLGMTINAVESRRNLLQLYLRWAGPADEKVKALESALDQLSIEEIGAMEMMQVANTLVTLHLYRGSLAEADRWMQIVRPLTADNDEYDIYTRANDGLLMVLRGDKGGPAKIAEAANLSALGSNRFALIQIRQDIVFCLGRARTNLASELVEIIDQQTKRIKA